MPYLWLTTHRSFRSVSTACTSSGVPLLTGCKWLLKDPSSPVMELSRSEGHCCPYYVIQDNLIHPVYGGNKARKLDGVVPYLIKAGVTDVVSCGGMQSAHTSALPAAIASMAGESVRVHLLVRGEQPSGTPAVGHHRLALQVASSVTYVSRDDYADRGRVLQLKAEEVQAMSPSGKVVIVPEGAQGPRSMLGMIRLVDWLAASSPVSPSPASHCPSSYCPTSLSSLSSYSSLSHQGLPEPRSTEYHIVIDSGTGTSAIGAAIGVRLLGLPWRIWGVMLAGEKEYYEAQAKMLCRAFIDEFDLAGGLDLTEPLPLTWTVRPRPRRFGKVLDGDVEACKKVLVQHGLVVDPIWTLSAWEVAADLSRSFADPHNKPPGGRVGPPKKAVMLHTGGSEKALEGLVQRFGARLDFLKDLSILRSF